MTPTIKDQRRDVVRRLSKLARKKSARGWTDADASDFKRAADELRRIDSAAARVKRATLRPTTTPRPSATPTQAKYDPAEVLAAVRAADRTTPRKDSAVSTTKTPPRSLREYVARSLTSSDSQGGYLIEQGLLGTAVDAVGEANPVMRDARLFDMGGRNELPITLNTADAGASWVTETGARSATTLPTYIRGTLNAFGLWAQTATTQTLLDAIGGEAQVVRDMLRAMNNEFDKALCTGTGSGEPVGVFTTAAGFPIVASGSAGHLVAVKVREGFFDLPAHHHAGAKFYASLTAYEELTSLERVTGSGIPLVEFGPNGPMMLGKPLEIGRNIPALASGAICLAYGSMSNALAVGRQRDVKVVADPFSSKPDVLLDGYGALAGMPLDTTALVLFSAAS